MTPTELRHRREALGLSKAEMARQLDVTYDAYARWENGEYRIRRPGQLDLALEALERRRMAEAGLGWQCSNGIWHGFGDTPDAAYADYRAFDVSKA